MKLCNFDHITAASYYPQLLAAASNPLRFIPQIQSLRKLIQSGKAGRVLLVEARLKQKVGLLIM